MVRHVLVYDAGCGPCRRFRRLVEFLDVHDSISYVSLEGAEAEGLLEGIEPRLRHRSFHLLTDGLPASGSKAIPGLVSLFPMGGPLSLAIIRFWPAARVVDFAYSVLSRLHDSGACKYPLPYS